MKSTFISTSALSAATRVSLIKAQTKLAEAQKEVTTGRLADVGAALGYKTGQTITLRQDHVRLKTIIDTNSVVSTRLSATQAALKSLSDDAQLFVSQLIAARNREATARYGWSPYLHDPKLKGRLHRIRIPTLFLWGAADRILSEAYGRAYCAAIAGARFETIERAGHYPHIEQPDEFARRIFAFTQESAR